MAEKEPKKKGTRKSKEKTPATPKKEEVREDKSVVVAEVPKAPALPANVRPGWTREEVELIKQTVAKGATDSELKLFLHTAQKSGLDPFSRQIFFVKRKQKQGNNYIEVATIQTGIDGYRAIAERTGELAGIDDPVFEEEDKSVFPKIARVTVYRMVDKGGGLKEKVGFTASARWSEYAPDLTYGGFMWKKMPYLMLGKCAEALALRKAFPNDLSGIYTAEEMAQADRSNPVPSIGQRIAPREPERVIEMDASESQEVPSKEKVIDVGGGDEPQDIRNIEDVRDVDYSAPPFPDKPAPKKKESKKAEPLKVKIFSLLKELGIDTSTKESCEKAVAELTGFDLHEENYEKIIEKLNSYKEQRQ